MSYLITVFVVNSPRSITLADETGHIYLVLWRQRAEEVNFKAGDVLSLQNVVVSTFREQTTVTTSFETALNIVDKDIAVNEAAIPLTEQLPWWPPFSL